MDATTLLRSIGAWLVMLVLALANGGLRDFTYGKRMGELSAHQLSTLTGMVLLGAVIALFVRRWPPASGGEALRLGLLWMAMTVAFEFVFFHYAGGHPWSELLANYNVLRGRVWLFLVLWIGIAPWLFHQWLARG